MLDKIIFDCILLTLLQTESDSHAAIKQTNKQTKHSAQYVCMVNDVTHILQSHTLLFMYTELKQSVDAFTSQLTES